MKPSNEATTTGVDLLKPKTRNLVLLLRINLAVNLVGAIISGIEWFFADSLSMGHHVSHDLFEPVDALYRNAWYLQFGLYLFTALVFLSWFSQAYSNLKELKVADRKYSTGWAVGGWFIPVGNLIIPYNVMKEVWKGSSPAGYNSKNSHAWKKVSDHGPVREWWIANIVLTAVNMRLFDLNGINPSASSSGTIYKLVSYVLVAILAMLAVSVVKGVQSRQSGRLQAIRNADIADGIEPG